MYVFQAEISTERIAKGKQTRFLFFLCHQAMKSAIGLVVGFGLTYSESSRTVCVLREVHVDIFSRRKCRLSDNPSEFSKIDTICAGADTGGRDSCQVSGYLSLAEHSNDENSAQGRQWRIAAGERRNRKIFYRWNRFTRWGMRPAQTSWCVYKCFVSFGLDRRNRLGQQLRRREKLYIVCLPSKCKILLKTT